MGLLGLDKLISRIGPQLKTGISNGIDDGTKRAVVNIDEYLQELRRCLDGYEITIKIQCKKKEENG